MRSIPSNFRSRIARAGLVLIAITIAMVSAGESAGQVLDLAPAPKPPKLGDNAYANTLVTALHEELQELVEREREAAEAKRPVYRAMVNCRIIAAELLAAGDSGSGAYLIGVRLFNGRDDLDAALDRLLVLIDELAAGPEKVSETEEDQINRAWQAVRRFDQLAIDMAEDVRTAVTRSLDKSLPTIFAPLAEAIALVTETEIVSHWPPRTAARSLSTSGDATPAPAPRPRQSPQQLSNRLNLSPLDPESRDEFIAIIAMLKRAEAYPDLRPQVDSLCSLIARGLDLAEAVARADWLDEEQRARYARLLRRAVALLADPQTRPGGRQQLERLDLSRLIIERTSTLQNDRDAQNAIGAALLAADAALDNESSDEDNQSSRQRLTRLRRVLDRMIAYRESGEPDLPRELRVVHRDLDNTYRQAERALLADVTAIATDSQALSDPAFATLLADQHEFLEALLCVHRMPVWTQKIGLMDPASVEPFSAQMRKNARQVMDPNRRPQAVRALTDFDRQVDRFYPLPFEAELAAASAEAVEATGGLNRRLLDELQKQRTAWARTWATPDPDPAVIDRMTLMHRLMSTMADTVEARRLGSDGGRIFNRWAAWELAPATLARTLNDVPTRLKLATGAVLQSDDLGLTRQLDRLDLDAPLARLIGRMNLIIGPAMGDLPPGAPGIMGQVTRPPTADAWMVHRRAEIASLCRYALEQDHARREGDAELAGEIGQYVNHLAEALLSELDAP